MHSLPGFATELTSLAAVLPRLKEAGFAPELCPSLCFSQADLREYREGGGAARDARALRDAHLPCSWHAYFYSMDLGAVDTQVRAYSRDTMLLDLECAAWLGARDVVMHSGYIPQVMYFLFDYWFDLYSESFQVISDRARDLGLRICVENVFERDGGFSARLLARFTQGHIGLCFDPGHWHVHAQAPFEVYTEAAQGRILRLHLHDNDGASDKHLALGQGNMDFARLHRLLCAQGEMPAITYEGGGDLDGAIASRAYFEGL